MNGEDADLLSFDDLASMLSEDIGNKLTDEEKIQKDLEEALENKKPAADEGLYLDLEDKEIEENEPKETNKDSIKGGTDTKPAAEKGGDDTSKPQGEESEFYRKALRNLFGDSVDVLTVLDENDQEVEVSLDDIDINDEYFREIVQGKLDLDKQEVLKGKVDITGNSDFAIKLLEIDKNGGDISQLLQYKEAYTDPLAELDLDNVQDQKEAIFLRSKAKGLSDLEIKALISGFEKDGNLKEAAEISKRELEEAVNKLTEQRLQQSEELKKKAEEADKEYRKKMKEASSSFQIKDSVRDKIVNIATKKNDKGSYDIDELYFEAVKDPEKAFRLALFLLDENEYNSQVSSSKVTEEQIKTANRVRITGTKSSPNVDRAKRDSDYIPIEDLFKTSK
jgi:flagellar hook-basal body complex protein FliE